MNRTATALLVAAALAALAVVLFFANRGKSAPLPVGAPLFAFNPDEITQIKITNGDEVFELRLTDEGWAIGPTPKDRASVTAVRNLIQTALETPVLDHISAQELADRDRLSSFGLKKSRVQLDFRGDRNLPLLVGKDAADDSRSYVRFEDSRDVYLIPDALVNALLNSPQDFRDRMPVRVRPDRVDRIAIRRGTGEIELLRDSGGWRILRPLAAKADDQAVEKLLGQIMDLRIQGFENRGDPLVTGLAEPTATLLLYGAGDREPESIRVGSPALQGGVYAELPARGVTAILPARVLDILSTTTDSIRDKALLRVNMDLVDMIRVVAPGGEFTLKRDGENWLLAGQKVKGGTVSAMADALAAATSQAFKPATPGEKESVGLSLPLLTVEFYSVLSENTPETTAGNSLLAAVSFGAEQPDGLVATLVAGSPEINFVPKITLDSIPTSPNAWLPGATPPHAQREQKPQP